MAKSFLFGGNSGQSQSKYLVEFRAGKMTMKGNMVYPIKKKGSVFLNQSDDSLMHFCWKDRTTGQVEDDLIIFPEEAEFKKVPQCTTGRVFVLKFKSSTRRSFYWMQEPKDDKDVEFCQKINEYLNNPPTPGSRATSNSGSSSGGLGSLDIGNISESDLHNLLNNMNPQQLMQMLSGVGGLPAGGNLAGLLGQLPSGSSGSGRTRNAASAASSSTTTTTTTPRQTLTSPTEPVLANVPPPSVAESASASSSGSGAGSPSQSAIQLSDLQSIISGIKMPQGQKSDVNDLSSSVNWDALQFLLDNKDFMERVRSMLPSEPVAESSSTSPSTASNLAETVKSPQFQQSLSIFSAALQSGQLGPLMNQFGLSKACVDAANAGDIEDFVRALEDWQKNQKTEVKDQSKKSDKSEGGGSDDGMALD